MSLKILPIKELVSNNLLKSFDCGIEALNVFLSRYAARNDALGIGKTFLAADENGKLAGYFTLATAQVAFEEIPEECRAKLPKYPIPALRIARLAVNKNMQGAGIGKYLLTEAFKKIIAVSEITGLKFVIVDAKENSKTFYERYGFIKFSEKELCYFLPIETVRMAII